MLSSRYPLKVISNAYQHLRIDEGQESMTGYRKAVFSIISDPAALPDENLVLFAGAGLSKRHLSLPSWYELLEDILLDIRAPHPLDFYLQKNGNLIDAAKDVAVSVHQWGWSDGRAEFPAELFDADSSHINFLKHLVALKIKSATTEMLKASGPNETAEIERLRGIALQNIVTTNYDQFWEEVFGFTAVSGLDSILHNPKEGVSVVKIHGCVTAPSSMVLLPEDYANYSIRHKYIFSKLLVYFAEHPVLFVGYSLSDPDIVALIVDTANALRMPYLKNVFVLSMREEPRSLTESSSRYRVTSDAGSAEVNLIETNDFAWVYQAFS